MGQSRITRRSFMERSGMAVGTALTGAHAVGAAQGRQPNILFIFSDQQRCDTIGCYGDNMGRALGLSPNLDAMAAEGVRFQNAFTCQPVCGPARACLQTGLYATETGCKTLRVKHNHMIGYFVEVPQNVGEDLLKEPWKDTFVHRQTMAGAMRFEASCAWGTVPAPAPCFGFHWCAPAGLFVSSHSKLNRFQK